MFVRFTQIVRTNVVRNSSAIVISHGFVVVMQPVLKELVHIIII